MYDYILVGMYLDKIVYRYNKISNLCWLINNLMVYIKKKYR